MLDHWPGTHTYIHSAVTPSVSFSLSLYLSDFPSPLPFSPQIMEELQNNGVHIYQFPGDDEAVADLNRKMNEQVPFAVVGSREELVVNGHKVRARMYPWGTVEGKSTTDHLPTQSVKR